MNKAPSLLVGELLVVGVDHRTAPVALRDQLYIEPDDQPAFLEQVRQAGIGEACLLSTCNRTAVVAADGDPEAAATALLGVLAARADIDPAALQGQSFRYMGEDALRHIFALAASLESQVVGEPQILGQVKESHRLAAGAGLCGPRLEAVLQAAYGAAKRVRNSTPVAEQPVTIAASMLLVARQIHGDLSHCSVLLIGLGEMGEMIASELSEAGVGHLTVVHPSIARAEAAALRLQCHVQDWARLDAQLAESEIVVSASGTGRHTVSTTMAEAALRRRKRRPIFFVDAAVPADIEPSVGPVNGAFVYDLDDLEGVARKGKASREATLEAAQRVVDDEVERFLSTLAEREAGPAVKALRDHFEATRTEILTNGKLDAETATRLLIKRLLHGPSEALRQASADSVASDRSLEKTVRRLFGLDDKAQSAPPRTKGEEEA